MTLKPWQSDPLEPLGARASSPQDNKQAPETDALPATAISATGPMRARIPDRAQAIRPLAYRLCTLCERKGRAEDARAYNESVAAWSSIPQASEDAGIIGSQKQLNI